MTWMRPDITAKEKKRLLVAETRANQWLADGNEFSDQAFGYRFCCPMKAEKIYKKAADCYAKSQYWLDVANKLRGLD